MDTIDSFEEGLRYAVSNESCWSAVLSELIDRQDAIANKIGFGRGKVGKD
jgi:hypothetical protein